MEVFTVSVGIGRVAISVRQTRQVVSRLHADICHNLWKSAHHRKRSTPSGLTPLCRGSGDLPPSGPYMYGALVFKLTGFDPPTRADTIEASYLARTAPDSLSPYQGMLFKPFGLIGGSFLSTPIALRLHPFSVGCANLAPPCQTGELPQYQPDI